ncbi:type II secretion system F family protein [Sedimentibacter sp. zth1]|uniref:type II secretion system F family protein n=1 Tax=Sedimentibacter sp. zth1 TaxID=2816908 RepID=UPI001A90FD18|nr:type II secretion system F family protein [Sedimentibacter sp. zth1]QSX04843.1 type II secretion system F family protein [Sedimentibacter sp. zth1]
MLSKVYKVDYDLYHMKYIDYIIGYCIGFLLAFVVLTIFFESIILSMLISIPSGLFSIKPYKNYLIKKRKKKLLLQFKDFLESLSSSYLSGKNTHDAFIDTYDDMEILYGNDADITREIEIIKKSIINGINMEDILEDFAQRSHIDDIKSFASIFESCNRTGGDISKIILETREIINDKIDIEMEIRTSIAQKKAEFYIMCIMPFVMVLSLRMLGDSTFSTQNISNIVTRLIALVILIIAFFLGKKITDIKV